MSYNTLFQKVYEMMKWVYSTASKFPKHRSVLAQRIEVTSIRILELVIDLSNRDTKTNRRKILYEVHKLQILFRLCKDLSHLSFRKYEHISTLLDEISGIIDRRHGGGDLTRIYKNLYKELCSFRNLELAYRKARKNKRNKSSVQEFELNLERNLLQLKQELETLTYKPRPLRQFVIRDPKTRVISASHFRDRVIHHAVCNVIQPVFERAFILDSYANQKNKGTHATLRRFDKFKGKASGNGRLVNNPKGNNMVIGYVLKADIRHYFDEVDKGILLSILKHRIKDGNVMGLIRKILENHTHKDKNTGMPLGNLTSQFFANIYLNHLDYFVKHELKVKFYIRYVDDFVILHNSLEALSGYRTRIENFLKTIKLELHLEKSKTYPMNKGTKLVGYRVFHHYMLPKKSNIRAFRRRLVALEKLNNEGAITFQKLIESVNGWLAYAAHANTYKLRKEVERNVKTNLERRCHEL